MTRDSPAMGSCHGAKSSDGRSRVEGVQHPLMNGTRCLLALELRARGILAPMKITRLTVSLFLLSLTISLGPAFAKETCSIRPPKNTKKADLPALARVTKEQAQATAIASVPNSEVKESELEVEHGCLIWSFDLKLAGKDGVQEVEVDAGNGKVLSSQYESPKKEAAEAAKDKKAKP